MDFPMHPISLCFRSRDVEQRFMAHYYRPAPFEAEKVVHLCGLASAVLATARSVYFRGVEESLMFVVYAVTWIMLLAGRTVLDRARGSSDYSRRRLLWALFGRFLNAAELRVIIPRSWTSLAYSWDTPLAVVRSFFYDCGFVAIFTQHLTFPLPFKYETIAGVLTALLMFVTVNKGYCAKMLSSKVAFSALTKISGTITVLCDWVLLFLGHAKVPQPKITPQRICPAVLIFIFATAGVCIPTHLVWWQEKTYREQFANSLRNDDTESQNVSGHRSPRFRVAIHCVCLIFACACLWQLLEDPECPLV